MAENFSGSLVRPSRCELADYIKDRKMVGVDLVYILPAGGYLRLRDHEGAAWSLGFAVSTTAARRTDYSALRQP